MNKLAIIGAGDLGQLIAYHAIQSDFLVVGFYDDYKEKGTHIDGNFVLGKLNKIQSDYEIGRFDYLIIAVGYNHMPFRKQLFDTFYPQVKFANVIHPSSYIDKSCKIGNGVFILPHCVLDRNVHIGNNVLLNINCTIAHDASIGDHSFLSPAVSVAGFTSIGRCCTIGIGSNIIDKISVNEYVQTAGGSVVIKSLTESGLYAGVPAILKRRLHV